MRVKTPEISWHTKEAIYSVDIQPQLKDQPTRLATAGIDGNVRIWEIKPEQKYGVTFLANLARHDKAVNVVKFSKSGQILASGGDDGTIILWKLSDKEEPPNIFDDDSDIGKNVESWNAIKILRGHLEDINELSWSDDENYMISGSIDRTAILWDISKGHKISILSDAKHFIQGVAWDPLDQYVATMSCDRSLRIYNIQNHRVIHNVQKMTYPENSKIVDEVSGDGAGGNNVTHSKPQRMFHDENVVRRRFGFTCDGSLLIVPAGCLSIERNEQMQQINTAFIFVRGCLSKPAVVLPGFKEPATVVRCCPIRFQLKSYDEDSINPFIKLPYRMVFGVSTSDTLLLFDTQHLEPFAVIGNIHYAAITDLTWSSDGRYLVVSSRDGFCTIVFFDQDELGIKYEDESKLEKNETVIVKDVPQDTFHVDTEIIDSIPAKRILSEDAVITVSDESSEVQDAVTVEHSKANPKKPRNASKNAAYDKLSKSELDLNSSQHNGQRFECSQNTGSNRDENMDVDGQKEPSSKDQLPQVPVQDSPSPSDKSILSKGSRRVQLTTISAYGDKKMTKTPLKDKSPSNQDTTTSDPQKHLNNIVSSSQKKTPRRIQLIPVNENN